MNDKDFPTYVQWLERRLDKLEAAVRFYIGHAQNLDGNDIELSIKCADHWRKEIEKIVGPVK